MNNAKSSLEIFAAYSVTRGDSILTDTFIGSFYINSTHTMQHAEILSLAGLRIDGRRPEEMRSLRHTFGVNPEANGSVFFEQGLNKLMVNVHGPHEPTRRVSQDEEAEVVVRVSQAPFAGTEWKKKRVGDRKIVEMEAKIKEILEAVIDVKLYPKSQITVSVNIFEADGSSLCAMINAIGMALMDAGIAMADMIVACSVGNIKGMICCDCTQVEQNSGGAYVPVVMKARSQEIVYLNLDNRLSADTLENVLHAAQKGCEKFRLYAEEAIKGHMEAAS